MARRILLLLLAVLWIPLGAAATKATLTSLVLEESPTLGLEITYDEVLTEDLMAEMGVVDDMTSVDGHMRAWADADRSIVLILVDGERADPHFSVGFLRGASGSMEEEGLEVLEWPDVGYAHVVGASSVDPETFSASAGENGFGIHVIANGPGAEAMARSTLTGQIERLPARIGLEDPLPLDGGSRSAELVGRVLFYVLLGMAIWFVVKRRRRAKTSAAGGHAGPMELL